MKYCRCTRPLFDFDSASLAILAGGDDDGQAVWVCDNCNGVHHFFQQYEGDEFMRAPAKATAPLGTTSFEDGHSITRWATANGRKEVIEFRPYPRIIPMSDREPLIFKTWQHLQTKVAVILRPVEGPGDNAIQADDRERARNEARGIAEVLAMLMQPFMDPPEGSTKSAADMVVSHAVKYYRDSTHEVPGLGLYLWNPEFNHDGSRRVMIAAEDAKKAKPAARPRTPAAPKVNNASTKQLAPEEIDAVKFALSTGKFTEAKLAELYGVSLATIKAAAA